MQETIEVKARVLIDKLLLENSIYYVMCKLKDYDLTTFYHSLNVAYLTAQVGTHMNFELPVIEEMTKGALLHDIGKLMTPLSILKKTSSLTEKEYAIIKNHPIDGFRIMEDANMSELSMKIIKNHHERSDGSGYPRNLVSKEITPEIQIVIIADVFDAMTSKRPYKEAYTEVYGIISLEMLCNERQFERKYVEELSKVIKSCPPWAELFDNDKIACN